MVVEVALIVMGALVAAEMLLFLLLPKQLVRWLGPSHRQGAIRLLEGMARVPPVLTPNVKISLYYHLLVLYLQEKRDADCIRVCRLLLTLRLPSSLKADCTRRLADCLDRAGQLDEASALRRGVLSETAESARATSVQLLAQAQMLVKEQQFEAAYPLFERGLKQVAPDDASRRRQFMTALMTCAFHRGMIAETAQWAEDALRAGAPAQVPATIGMACHRMAGIAYTNLGNLDEAERHYREHLAVAETEGGTALSESITFLAGLTLKRGKLHEAIELCARATALNPLRTTCMLQSDAHRYLGEFDAACADLQMARTVSIHQDQRREQYSLALLDLNECWIHCWAERPEEARTALNRAKPILSQQDKLLLYIESTELWLGALAHHTNHVEEDAVALLKRAERFKDDNSVQTNVEQILGRALYHAEVYGPALERWQRVLAIETTEGMSPLAWWHVSKCLAGLGRDAEARAAMASAAASTSDIYYVRLAQEQS